MLQSCYKKIGIKQTTSRGLLRLAVFLLSFLSLFTAIGQINFQNPLVINTRDGLPMDEIADIAEDWEGFTWIGTRYGLCRTDGLSVNCFLHNDDDPKTIKSDIIHEVLPDSINRKIWIANHGGLSAYDTRNKLMLNYSYDVENINSPPEGQAITLFIDSERNVWIGYQMGGLVRYRPESDDFERLLCPNSFDSKGNPRCSESVHSMVEDTEDSSILWLGTGRGLLRFNKNTHETERFYWENSDKKRQGYRNSFHSIYAPGNGKFYLGTWYEGVIVFDLSSKSFSLLDPCYEKDLKPYHEPVVRSFYPKSKDEFWINSREGLQLYNLRTNCISFVADNNARKKEWYSVNHIDDQQRIWSATKVDGLHIYNPILQQFEEHVFASEESPFIHQTMDLLEDTIRKRIYVACTSSDGLYYLDQQTSQWHTVYLSPELADPEDRELSLLGLGLMEDGSVLMTHPDGLYIYRLGSTHLEPYSVDLPQGIRRMQRIIKDDSGQFWISGWNAGFMRLDPQSRTLNTFEEEFAAITSSYKRAGDFMLEDNYGNIWFRDNNGLLIYEKAKNKFTFHEHHPPSGKILRGMGMMDTGSDGSIWIAHYGFGLARAHSDSIQQGVLDHYGAANGLLGKRVFLVFLINDQPVVITEKGMELFDPYSKRFKLFFDAQYGLPEVNSYTWLSDGRLALGLRRKILIIDPYHLKINEEAPRPYVSSFSIFDEPQKLSYEVDQVDSFYLSHQQNFFSFEISGLGYNLPSQTRFRYKLEGFDPDWQDGSKRKFASYTNVPSGEYRFLVEAINNENVISSAPSVTWLYISQVWYNTWWFWSLAGFTLLLLGWGIYRYRVGQIRKEERLKTTYEKKLAQVEMSALRAQMNPHFIFNSLNSIEYYIIENDPVMASDYLNRFSRLIRLILQNSKSTAVPLKDELEALRLYIEMESLRFDQLFDYELRVQSGLNLDKIQVPPMLMQPYVENAIWHGLMQKKGEKGKLELILKKEEDQLLCIIEDNGIGRQAAKELKSKSATTRKSYGMKITSDRLDMISKLADVRASVEVSDLVDDKGAIAGTRVELRMPLRRSR